MSLIIRNVSKSFEGLKALDSLSLSALEGQVTGLIGPNGAGKTTLFNAVSGFLHVDAGSIRLNDKELIKKAPRTIARHGVARSFQNLRLFPEMTVYEQTLLTVERMGMRSSKANAHRVDAILERVSLDWAKNVKAAALAFGEQKALSLARMLALGGSVWLLDEPASGLGPQEFELFRSVVAEAKSEGVIIVLIEHNLDLVREVADVVTFLDRGRSLATGSVHDVLGDPDVRALYFGQRTAEGFDDA